MGETAILLINLILYGCYNFLLFLTILAVVPGIAGGFQAVSTLSDDQFFCISYIHLGD